MGIRVFWLESTDQQRVSLRRYVHGSTCPLPWGYHNARTLIGESPLSLDEEMLRPSDDDVRWPTHCDCGYAFQESDARQLFNEPLYRSAVDGSLHTLRDAPPGAMWDASWMRGHGGGGEPWTGPDGISLVVRLPDGSDWMPDSEASNCTSTQWTPTENGGKRWSGRTHFCWVRHGDPRSGDVHIDKNGNTCGAGGGSIQSAKWHGFLHHGELHT